MELKRICHEINYWEDIFSQQQKKQLSAQTIIPDTAPDALATHESCAVVLVGTRQVMPGRVEVTGRVLCRTVYSAEEEGAWKVETSLPYTAVFEDDAIEAGDAVVVRVWGDRVDSTVVNSRKIGVDVSICIAVDVYRKVQREICCGVEDGQQYGIQLKCRSVKKDMVCSVSQKSFDLTDNFDLGANNAGAEELLQTDVSLAQSDYKVVGSKMILKGLLAVRCRYRTYEGTVQANSFELPFSQILELDSDENAQCDLSFYFEDLSLEPVNDSYYEGKNIALTAKLTVQAVCSCKTELECVEDIYSTAYELVPMFEALDRNGEAVVLKGASIDETKRIDAKNLPSLVMRPVAQGEELWEAAKRWKTTEEAIIEINALEAGKNPSGKMLLIPVLG